MDPLPVDEALPALLEALARAGTAVLRAPTGAGKTTRVPPALLDSGAAGDGSVVVVEPRRIAARAAAARVAFERGARLGGEVGYHVRFDRRAGRDTRILFVTEGLFVRRLQDDPFLEGVGAVVFDEFHERSLDVDLGLAMARRVQADAREDLRLVVTSATLDTDALVARLDAPLVESEGRRYPVEVRYLERADDGPLHGRVAAGVARALEASGGDVLAFLPGVGEIRRAREALTDLAGRRGVRLLELYGDLSPERQDAVLAPGDGRRVVLATNVAQTSITVPGVTAVVDSGLARTLRFDAALGLDRLELGRISRASADQRSGRAGRTSPGVCLRLWTEAEHGLLSEHDEPEVRRVDLAPAVLQLACWGERDVAAFDWYERPPDAALASANELLRRLGAIDARGPTALGRELVRLPAHPRVARMLVEGSRLGHAERVALAAALLGEREPWRDRRSRRPRVGGSSDLLDRVLALEAFEETGARGSELGELHVASARFVLRARDQLARQLDARGRAGSAGVPFEEALLRATHAAFADRLVRRRSVGEARGVLAGGRGVRLDPASVVTDAPLFVAVELDAGRRAERAEALVRIASAVRLEWFDVERFETVDEVAFDAARERVVGVRRRLLDGVVVAEEPVAVADAERAGEALADAAVQALERVFPFGDRDVSDFLARARCLAEWAPELELPSFGDDVLREVVREASRGRRSFEDLRRAPWLELLKGRMDWKALQTLDREAPERIEVPSGSRVRLVYEPGKPPVLAARIQELFGLARTPRVARGRVGLLMHLLAPNMRPQQVTDDLESFWSTTYAEVRKELRRRYPKHAWPEDPHTATAERRPRRRR